MNVNNNQKMVSSAALDGLARREQIEQNARVVIEFALTLPVQKSRQIFSGTFNSTGENSGLSGHTEFGDANYKRGGSETKTRETHLGGPEKLRIGHYKVWRDGTGSIQFHYYAQSDFTTQPNGELQPEVFCLLFNPNTKELEQFGAWTYRILFSVNLFGITWSLRKTFIKFDFDGTQKPSPSGLSIFGDLKINY